IMELSKEPRGFAGTWVHQLHSGFDSDMLQYKGYPEISDDGIYPVCTFGATGYIDKWLIGEDHIYRYPANKRVLGTISSVVAGKIILMYHKQPLSVGKRFLIWAVLL
ncbi:unnamed protein product, partial [Lepidochelys olivacea]